MAKTSVPVVITVSYGPISSSLRRSKSGAKEDHVGDRLPPHTHLLMMNQGKAEESSVNSVTVPGTCFRMSWKRVTRAQGLNGRGDTQQGVPSTGKDRE